MRSSIGAMMLVHILILLHIAAFCHGKSLDYRGKRSYDHQKRPELHGNFYYPRIEGQPIYIPPIGHSAEDMNEFLDEYYRNIEESLQTRTLENQFPYKHDSDYIESPVTSNSMVQTFFETTDKDGHRGDFHVLPTKSHLKYHEFNQSYNVKKHGNEKSLLQDKKPVNDEYEQLSVLDRVNVKKSGDKKYVPKTVSHMEYELDDQYEPPIVRDRINIKKYGNKKSLLRDKKPVKDEYEQLAVLDRANVNKSEDKKYVPKTESHLEYELDDQYEPPIVRDRINIKKSGSKTPIPKTYSELEYVDYEQPVVRDRINVKKSGDKAAIPKAELEYEDSNYEQPVVRDRINVKKSGNKTPIHKTELEYVGYEQPVVKKSDKAPIPKTESELDYTDYEEPVVSDKIIVKKSGDKTYFPETESKLEYAEYEYEPVELETLKGDKVKIASKQDKKRPSVPSSINYGSDFKETKVSNKSNKGKRRKHSQPPKKYETSSDYSVTVVKRENFEYLPESENYDLDTGHYESKNTKNKGGAKEIPVKTKVVIKSEAKETPVKTKEKVVIKSEAKETPVKTKEKVVIKSEAKETPVKTKEKVVIKSEAKETPVKSKEKVVIKSEAKETPVKTKVKVSEPNDYEYNSNYGKTREIEDNADEVISEDSEGNAENFDQPENFSESDHASNPNEPFSAEENEFEGSGNDLLEDGENSINIPRFFPAIESLSALNSNLWSLVFNPDAERQNLKTCITRSNETGYCTYVQHCEVPDIAASFEQLLNNACVIDDVFIGVCCPEFPVQTVKVHWDQDISNSNKQAEVEFGHKADDCGIRSNEALQVQSWPWKAPLVSMSNGKVFCGGVVINEDYILTAAHCTTKIPRNQILVRLGQFDDSTGEDFAVVEIKRHAQYNPRTMNNDVALLKLGRRIVQDHYTGVICLPEGDVDIDKHGEKAILLGWKGMFGTNSNKTEFLKVMEQEECRNKLPTAIPKTVLCTETRSEDERTCNADSGAPLVIEDDGKFEVIGILSWNRNDCDQRYPSTFSRVSSYVGWIRKHAV